MHLSVSRGYKSSAAPGHANPHILHLDMSTPQGSMLHLDSRSLCCSWTSLHRKSLSCTWKCLHYIGLCCSQMCLLNTGLSCTWHCLDINNHVSAGVYTTEPELHLNISTLQLLVLHMDVSTPQGPKLQLEPHLHNMENIHLSILNGNFIYLQHKRWTLEHYSNLSLLVFFLAP